MKKVHAFSVIFAVLLVSAGIRANAEDDTNPLPSHACDYYLQREMQSQCGSSGYFVNFGYHYCYEYLNHTWPTLSAPGRQWLNETLLCLQDEMKGIPIDTPCDGIWNIAVKQHATCYTQNGYCGLPVSDRIKIINTARRELLNPINLIGAAIFNFSCER